MDATAVRSAVAIHLTESGMWSCCQDRAVEGLPSVRVATDGSLITSVRETSSTESSPLCSIDDEYIDVDGGIAPVPDVLAAVLRAAVETVAGGPSVGAVLTYPTEWGTARQQVLADAGSAIAADTVLVPVAVAVAEIAGVAERDSTWAVVECRATGTTSTYVAATSGDYRVVEVEHESSLVVDDLDGQAEAITELAGRVCGGRELDGILLTDHLDTRHDLAPVRRAVVAAFGREVPVESVSGMDIVRALAMPRSDGVHEQSIVAIPQRNWLQPALQREQQERTRRSWPTLVAVAAALAVVTGAGVAFIQSTLHSVSTSTVEGVVAESQSPSAPASSSAAPSRSTIPSTAAGTGREVSVGGVRLTAPDRWRERPQSATPFRIELVPDGGADRRIIVTQNNLQGGAGYDEVAVTLAAKIAQRGRPELFAELEKDVVFGGRPGITYSEFPDENSAVRWHVVVERDLQVSVGCQFLSAEWAEIEAECEHVVRSLEVDE
ncbi:type VII secretion-associated protein [Rhodococcus oxybenzonivorans]|uniref:Type VII secretion-associated protein n=1 Tax=Rhodococcus oxybenzonivorans TaxID=1990687 RepID=A0A2S2BY49_9NOCA|nr:type VII secretion-associated protein [Rhodococcus oxybenzonivorans]